MIQIVDAPASEEPAVSDAKPGPKAKSGSGAAKKKAAKPAVNKSAQRRYDKAARWMSKFGEDGCVTLVSGRDGEHPIDFRVRVAEP